MFWCENWHSHSRVTNWINSLTRGSSTLNYRLYTHTFDWIVTLTLTLNPNPNPNPNPNDHTKWRTLLFLVIQLRLPMIRNTPIDLETSQILKHLVGYPVTFMHPSIFNDRSCGQDSGREVRLQSVIVREQLTRSCCNRGAAAANEDKHASSVSTASCCLCEYASLVWLNTYAVTNEPEAEGETTHDHTKWRTPLFLVIQLRLPMIRNTPTGDITDFKTLSRIPRGENLYHQSVCL